MCDDRSGSTIQDTCMKNGTCVGVPIPNSVAAPFKVTNVPVINETLTTFGSGQYAVCSLLFLKKNLYSCKKKKKSFLN